MTEQDQEKRMSNLLAQVEELSNQAVRKDYEPTPKERYDFGTLLAYLKGMEKWF